MRNLEKVINIRETSVMGILNLSENSFFDGGRYQVEDEIIMRCKEMLDQGAHVIDVGACSTKPGSEAISEEIEHLKIKQTVLKLREIFPAAILSVDTFRASVAKVGIESGADIINDVSGGEMDSNMIPFIGSNQIPYILGHMQGVPLTMQNEPSYSNVTLELLEYFQKKIELLITLGNKCLWIDPCFGFGKNLEHNYTLLRDLNCFKKLGFPLVVGLSRKGIIQKTLNVKAKDALNGTTVLNTIALLNGGNILRVHDVKEAMESVRLVNEYQKKR